MIEWTSSAEAIARDFESESIPTNSPGFYDHPEFLRVEEGDPRYLNNYARFVDAFPFGTPYLSSTRDLLERVLPALFPHFEATGRIGGCVDFSIVLSRILEQEGIWNYAVKGALTVTFPPEAGLNPQYFWPVDDGNFVAGHAWVVAPPYRVIDMSLQSQPWLGDAANWVPGWVASDGPSSSNASYLDIVSPVARSRLRAQGVEAADLLATINPDLQPFTEHFPATEVHVDGTCLKYSPVAVGAPDCPFEDVRVLDFEGKTPAEFYEAEVRSLFQEARGD